MQPQSGQGRFSVRWNGIIATFLLFMISLAACQPGSSPAPLANTAAPASSPPASIDAAAQVPTSTQATEPTPTPTPEPVTRGPELLTSFQVYDDFSGVFDLSEWVAVEPDSEEIYSFFNEYSILQISMDEAAYGYNNLFLEIPPHKLPEGINSIAAGLPLAGPEILESYGGVRVSLTDGVSSASLRCGLFQQQGTPRLLCELFEVDGIHVSQELASLAIPEFELHDISIAWVTDTGLVLLFLNDQLIGYYQMAASSPVYSLQAGIFINRYNPFDGGAFRFTNLRVGTPVLTDLDLPGDLLPSQSLTPMESTHVIDYYLFDDFDNPVADGLGNYNIWNISVPDNSQSLSSTSINFQQEDGALQVSGSGYLVLELREPLKDLRAIQAEVQPADGRSDDGFVMLQLAARTQNSLQLEYICFLEYEEGPWDHMYCRALNNRDEFLHQSEEIPVRGGEALSFGIAYDDALQQFEARINGVLVDRAPMDASQLDIINRLALTPQIGIQSTDSQAITMDDFQCGLKRDEITIPPQEPRVMVASLPHSDLFLYDDFSDPIFDTIWDFSRWTSIFSSDQGMYQQDGFLVIKRLEENQEIGAWKILASQFEAVTPEQANAIQVEFSGDPDHNYEGNTGFLLMIASVEKPVTILQQRSTGLMTRDGRGFSCSVYYLHDFAHFGCGPSGYPGAEDYESGRIRLDTANPHRVTLEYNQPDRTFYAYLDGIQVTQYTIQNQQLEHFVFDIQAQADAEGISEDRMFIDQVLIGTPANHPDLLVLPETPYETFDPFAAP